MTAIAPHVAAFLRERLPQQRGASPHTCEAYAYAFKLLFEYASARFNLPPSQLSLEQLDASLVMAFLDHLEEVRGNCPSTRNARLVAIKSFMGFVELRLPAIIEQSRQIHAIPSKKTDTPLVNYLDREEIEAVLNAPNLKTRSGVRDRAMVHVCFATALRVTELVTLPLTGLTLHPSANVRITGKGRRERTLPLWKRTAMDLRAWLAVRNARPGVETLFVNARGLPMTRSGFEYVLSKHTATATKNCSSLVGKKIAPHVLRHSCAQMMLQATGDLRKVALWLGHADIQTTERYLRSDPTEKLDALEAVVPLELQRGHFQVPDALIAMLQST
jgi:site-specific recombinase XerD